MKPNDLWPKDILDAKERVPATILREQAKLIQEKTDYKIYGDVSTAGSENLFVHTFNLIPGGMGNYKFELLRVEHTQRMYPVRIFSHDSEGVITAANEDQFMERLRELFASKATRNVLQTLAN